MNPMNYLLPLGAAVHHRRRRRALRRNAIVVFMCVELMLNACNLAFVTFSRMQRQPRRPGHRVLRDGRRRGRGRRRPGHHLTIFRTRRSASVDDANLLKY